MYTQQRPLRLEHLSGNTIFRRKGLYQLNLSQITPLLGVTTVAAGAAIFVIAATWRTYRHQARRAGFDSLGDYLRSAPRSDEETRDAVDLALWGVVICLLGLLFPPFLVVGLFPFFHGARKVAYSWMGLGLVDDADQSGV